MSELKILFDDKAVYIHMFICVGMYMYSLRKCTVVSCNAACLSWFLGMGWDVELRRWDDLCCYLTLEVKD